MFSNNRFADAVSPDKPTRPAAVTTGAFQHRIPSVSVAAAAVLIAAVYLAVNVAGTYGGHLTGVFYTGLAVRLPEAIDGHTHRVNDRQGYDAQYYHVIAHDPLLLRGFQSYIDNPRVRWRRIGLPGLAAFLAGGNDRYVDLIYVTLQLVFVFLGTWWLSLYIQSMGGHPLFGLLFMLIPAVLVSLDRMTVDLALAALTIGFAWYGRCALARPCTVSWSRLHLSGKPVCS